MRAIGMKLTGIIGLLFTLSIFIGCGSGSDLLDELATQYNGVAFSVDSGARTNEIDVIQNPDCDGDPATTNDAEEFLPFDAEVVIDSDETAAEFRVESYSVRFRRNRGSQNGTQIPAGSMPDLVGTTINPINHNISSEIIEPGSSTTLDLLVWVQGDKVVYTTILAPLFGTAVGTDFVYDMQVLLNCRTLEDQTFQITTPWTPVHFANFDNC